MKDQEPTPLGVALGPKEGKRKGEKRGFRCLHAMGIDHKVVRTPFLALIYS